jgi:CheY-like chemotaxis protein
VKALSILVVEDNQCLRESIGFLLEAAGHQAFVAANGKNALQVLERHAVDLVLTDIIMPEKDGFALIHEVQHKWPLLPIVAMSSGGGFVSQEYCLTTAKLFGVAALLQKPFGREELSSTIDNLMGLIPT